MRKIEDGGPAFPGWSLNHYTDNYPRGGMSLRDHFAGQAMAAMLTGHFSHYGHDNFWPRSDIAREAYEMADAMLDAREEGGR